MVGGCETKKSMIWGRQTVGKGKSGSSENKSLSVPTPHLLKVLLSYQHTHTAEQAGTFVGQMAHVKPSKAKMTLSMKEKNDK